MTHSTTSLLAFLALAGCGASSGIVPVGPDTFVLTEMRSQALGGGARAREAVLAEATGFCHQQGRSVAILDLLPDGDPRGIYWPTAFDATFRCVAPAAGTLQTHPG